jgi:phage terminase Nu1 subunit (DNA packaging protein)
VESESSPAKAKGCPQGGCACTPPLAVRAYARHRGVSHVAVLNAIKSERLRESVRGGKVVDVALADREWARNTNYAEAPVYVREREAEREIATARAPVAGPRPAPLPADVPPEAELSSNEAARIKTYWQARQAELDYRQEAGELVPARDVRHRLEDVFRTCRTKLLGVPGRLRQALPHLTHADQLAAENLVREALEDLASGAGGAP